MARIKPKPMMDSGSIWPDLRPKRRIPAADGAAGSMASR